ncbi:hypothetical protein EST38_g10984 [Candolleomyces aberdarensis]|uniref:Uncharacterized protein n=1 Tax=Candolleomyces aberdarensis TaxID=2316362 RepID=A0A4Q2D8B0_9AGAR|nr:hypothetical protein EST38_g10984 [Candolleomyces aberdarensis]
MPPTRISVSGLGSKAVKPKPEPLGRTQSYGKGSDFNPFYDGLQTLQGGTGSDSERAFGLPGNLNLTPVKVKTRKCQSLCTTPTVPSHCAPKKGLLRNPRAEAYVSPLRPRTRKSLSLLNGGRLNLDDSKPSSIGMSAWGSNKENVDIFFDNAFSSPVKKLELLPSPMVAFSNREDFSTKFKLEFSGPTLTDLAEPNFGDVMEAGSSHELLVNTANVRRSFVNTTTAEFDPDSKTFWNHGSEVDTSLALRTITPGRSSIESDRGPNTHQGHGFESISDYEIPPPKLRSSPFLAKPEELSPTMTEIFGEAIALPMARFEQEGFEIAYVVTSGSSSEESDYSTSEDQLVLVSTTQDSSTVSFTTPAHSSSSQSENTDERYDTQSDHEGVLFLSAAPNPNFEDEQDAGNRALEAASPLGSPYNPPEWLFFEGQEMGEPFDFDRAFQFIRESYSLRC